MSRRSITLLTPWFLISFLQNCETIKFCIFSFFFVFYPLPPPPSKFVLICYSCQRKLIQRALRSKRGIKDGERKFWQMITNSNVSKGKTGKVNDWIKVEVLKTGEFEMICPVHQIDIQIIFPFVPPTLHTYGNCCLSLLQSFLLNFHFLLYT